MNKGPLKSYPEAYDELYYRTHHSSLFDLNLDLIPSFSLAKKWLNAQPGEVIFDAGCGIGYLLNYVCLSVGRGIGVDFSHEAINQAANHYPKLNLVSGDLLRLSFRDNYFDKIICFNVIEHLQSQDKLLSELRRVLKQDGILVIGTNMKYAPCNLLYKLFKGDQTHEKELTISQFVSLVGRYFRVRATKKSSCVYRFTRPVNWIFHHLLRADIVLWAVK